MAPTSESAGPSNSLFDRVAGVIEQIRPAIQSDGGDVELVEVTAQGVAMVRFHGACVGCPSSSMTLRTGIEQNVKRCVPEVKAVEPV